MPDMLNNLIDQHLAGELDARRAALLRDWLRRDPTARRRFVEAAVLEAQLYRACANEAETVDALAAYTLAGAPEVPGATSVAPPLVSAAPVRRASACSTFTLPRISSRNLAIAAMLLIAIGVALLIVRPWKRAERPPTFANPNPVTRPTDTRPTDTPASPQLTSGQLLIDGKPAAQIALHQPVRVAVGAPAVLRLGDGSQATLAPASEATLLGRVGDVRQVIQLARGAGEFSVTHGGGQFRVDTPAGTVTALGTQFSVVVHGPRPAAAGRDPARDGAREGAVRDSVPREGSARDASARDGAARDSSPRDGATRDGAARDGPAREGAERDAPVLDVAVLSGVVRVDHSGRSVTMNAGERRTFRARPPAGRRGPVVEATIETIRPGTGELVATRAGDRPIRATYFLPADAEVIVDERPARLADLKPRMRVAMTLAATDRDHPADEPAEVVRIEARGRELPATLVAVDPDGRTLTIATGGEENRVEQRLALDPQVRVTLRGAPATLRAIERGSRIVVVVSADGQTVRAISAGRAGPRDGEREAPREGDARPDGPPRRDAPREAPRGEASPDAPR